jgi:16S rRNA (cytosine1402-N4)-methyltransferase
LVDEVISGLALPPGGVLWDLTVGDGGHAAALIKRSGEARVVGLDRDPEALDVAGRALASYGGRVRLVHGRLGEVARLASEGLWSAPDAVLMDLGTSTRHLLDPGRGFSFSADGPLDMRMDPGSGLSAREVVNASGAGELEGIFRTLGEERFAGRIARAILRRRACRPFERTSDLAGFVARTVPGRGRFHPATRVFQALRIHVNDELGELARGLQAVFGLLPPGARLAVISFHSLEDRIVKLAFRERAASGGWVVLTRKPVQATREEQRLNPRARSAKLRVLMREAA